MKYDNCAVELKETMLKNLVFTLKSPREFLIININGTRER